MGQEDSSLVPAEAPTEHLPVQHSDSPEEPTEVEDDDNNGLDSSESSAVSLVDSVGQQDSSPSSQGKKSPATLMRGLSSGDENPFSPFFIPKNPFLDLVGKVPRFKWTTFHLDLLEDLLVALHDMLEKLKK